VSAAVAGADIPADDFSLTWCVGRDAGDDQAAGVNLLPPGDGIAAFAARHGLDVSEEPAP
jgi:hypothetical protein